MDPLGFGPLTMTFTYGRQLTSYTEWFGGHLVVGKNACCKVMPEHIIPKRISILFGVDRRKAAKK